MQSIGDNMRRRPVSWFFAISLVIELAVVATFLSSGAARKLEAAIRATGLEERTDFVSAGRLVVLEPQSWLGVFLSILQPLSPDIAAFVVAALAFGLGGVVVLVRRYRFWSGDVGWRKGLQLWGLMLITFLAMSARTAGLNYMFVPRVLRVGQHALLLVWFPLALLARSSSTSEGDEETACAARVAALAGQMTPLAATLISASCGVWHSQRARILLGATVCGASRYSSDPHLAVLVLSIVMTYFYHMVRGETFIAISMHGLHNDSVFLQGRINAGGLGPYVVSELTLLAPIVVAACILLLLTGSKLGLEEKVGT